jgi:hypothetical protein
MLNIEAITKGIEALVEANAGQIVGGESNAPQTLGQLHQPDLYQDGSGNHKWGFSFSVTRKDQTA